MMTVSTRDVRFVVAAVTAAAGLVAGCGSCDEESATADIELATSEFPGFTVALPEGHTATSHSEPESGIHLLEDPGGEDGFVELRWNAQPEISEGSLERTRAIMASSLGEPVGDVPLAEDGGDGGPRISIVELRDQPITIALSFHHCAARGIVIHIGTYVKGARDDLVALHRRIAGSLACTAHEGPRLRRARVPALDLPDGFGYIRGSAPPMFAGADDSLYMVFHWLSNTLGMLEDPTVLGALFETEGFVAEPTRAAPIRRRRAGLEVRELSYRLRDEAGGTTSGAYVVAFHCRREDVTYMVVYFGEPDLDGAAARRYLDRARCPDGPVDTATLPEAGEVIGAACASGDETACGVLDDLAAQGLVDAPP